MSWLPKKVNPCPSYDRLFTTVLAQLPGAGKEQLEVEIANTFTAFCRETQVWRETTTRNLLAGLNRYELTPSANDAKVIFIITLTVNGQPYRPLGGDAVGDTDIFRTYEVLDDFASVRISPTPAADSAHGLAAVIGLMPCNGNLDLPGAIIERYFEPLRDGILERMLSHANRPYSNPQQAEIHKRKFHAALTRTRQEIRAGKSNASPPWIFPQIAPGRRRRGARTYGW